MSLSIGGGARIGLGRWAFGVLFGGAAGTYAAPMLSGSRIALWSGLIAARSSIRAWSTRSSWSGRAGGNGPIGKIT